MNQKSIKVINGASYTRISTLAQANDKGGIYRADSSPEIQKQRMKDYVKNKSTDEVTYEITHSFEDIGFSGKNTKRPDFKKLEKLIVLKKISFVIVTDLSRLSRSLQDFLSFMNLCNEHGVSIIVISAQIDTLSPQGKLFVNLLMTMYQFEREVTGQRVAQNALVRLKRDGKINGAKEILGLDLINDKSRKGHFQINQNEVQILNNIFNEFLGHGSKKLTFDYIQREKIEWKPGIPFTRQRFDLMFKMIHSRYRGVYPTNLKNFDELITGKIDEQDYELVELPHGPVISLELLDKVTNKLKNSNNKIRSNQRGGYVYPLSGLLFSKNGKRFQGQPGKGVQFRYYFNPEDKVRVRCEEIESKIFNRFKEYLKDEKQLKKLVSSTQARRKDKDEKYELEILMLEQDKIKLVLEKDDLLKQVMLLKDEENFRSILEELNSKLESIKNKINDIELEQVQLNKLKFQFVNDLQTKDLENIIKEVTKRINSLSNESKREFLFKILKRVVLDKSELELHFYDDLFGIKRNEGIEKTILDSGKLNHPSSSYGINGGSTGT